MIFNPLDHIESTSGDGSNPFESESALTNDTMGICPKCKNPFGNALVDNASVYYCEPCRVTQPIPVA